MIDLLKRPRMFLYVYFPINVMWNCESSGEAGDTLYSMAYTGRPQVFEKEGISLVQVISV